MADQLEKPRWAFTKKDPRGIHRELARGVRARIFPGEQTVLSVVHINPHSESKIHSHPEEQWGVLLEGECFRIQDGDECFMKAGDFWHTPANTPHGIRTEKCNALVLAISSPPRQESRLRSKKEKTGDRDLTPV